MIFRAPDFEGAYAIEPNSTADKPSPAFDGDAVVHAE